jgi:isocitrate/isopropylmalate dehydrogenase
MTVAPLLRQNIILPGPEVVAEAVKVLEAIFVGSPEVELKLETHLFGGCAIDELGEALPASTLQACKEADAILMGTSKMHLTPPPPPQTLSPICKAPSAVQNGVSTAKCAPNPACWPSARP